MSELERSSLPKVGRRSPGGDGRALRGRGRYDRSLTLEERARAQRTAIVEACQGLLQSSAAWPTVTEIVRDSGVGRNTFYEHFDQAGAVVDEVLGEAYAVVERRMTTWRGESPRSPAFAMRALARTWADAVRECGGLVAALVDYRRGALRGLLERELERAARLGVSAGYCPKQALHPLRLRALAAAGVELIPELLHEGDGEATRVLNTIIAAGLRAG